MKGISSLNSEENRVILSKAFFESEPVLAAAAKFTQDYYVSIQPIKENEFEVAIQAKPGVEANVNIIKEFCNELIDAQVRQDLQQQFGKIREMIVEQAFYPLEKK